MESAAIYLLVAQSVGSNPKAILTLPHYSACNVATIITIAVRYNTVWIFMELTGITTVSVER
jgi:hypothetical protein